MPKLFCPECGYKHEFLDKRPKFCMECGYAFTSLAKKTIEPPREKIEDAEEFEQPDSDYNIPRLDITEMNIGTRNTITIGQAVANPVPDTNFSRPGGGIKGLKQLQKEVATKKTRDIVAK